MKINFDDSVPLRSMNTKLHMCEQGEFLPASQSTLVCCVCVKISFAVGQIIVKKDINDGDMLVGED